MLRKRLWQEFSEMLKHALNLKACMLPASLTLLKLLMSLKFFSLLGPTNTAVEGLIKDKGFSAGFSSGCSEGSCIYQC